MCFTPFHRSLLSTFHFQSNRVLYGFFCGIVGGFGGAGFIALVLFSLSRLSGAVPFEGLPPIVLLVLSVTKLLPVASLALQNADRSTCHTSDRGQCRQNRQDWHRLTHTTQTLPGSQVFPVACLRSAHRTNQRRSGYPVLDPGRSVSCGTCS